MKKKYTIREHKNGIYKVQISTWVWFVYPHYIKALEEISEACTITNVSGCFSGSCYVYIVTTMPK